LNDLEFYGPNKIVVMKQGVTVRTAVPPMIDESKSHQN
jgi:hypothetical protein